MEYYNYTIIVASLGCILSLYAYSIELKVKKNSTYKAVCDISDKMSCSRTFTSTYGDILGISNSLLGIFFYLGLIGLMYFNYVTFAWYASIGSVLGSIYLAYILYTKVKSFCLICNAIYIVNIALVVLLYVQVF